MEKDYREMIKKLLALAESPNEHEAKAALLKAKELMAEHKLTEAELKDVKNKNVKKIKTGVMFSKRRDAWMNKLSAIIGENYCCQAFTYKEYNMQTREVGFVGLEDDIDICITIFKYAVDCIHSQQKKMKKDLVGYSEQYRKSVLTGYGDGFATGIDRAFKEQKSQKEEGWGLVMVMPIEVKDACSDMQRQAFNAAALDRMNRSAYAQGVEDGKKFDPGTKLNSERSEPVPCLA